MTAVRDGHVELRVTQLERTGAELQLSYGLRNVGAEGVWLLNCLYHRAPTGHFRLDPGKAYVHAEGQASVIVSKRLIEVPDDVSVEAPEVPCVTRLAPGAAISESLRLPLPLKEVGPYLFGAGKTLATGELRTLHLRLGYLLHDEEIRFHPGTDTEGKPFTFPSYRDAVKRQRVIASGPLPFPVEKKGP